MAFDPYETFNDLKGRYTDANERRDKLGGTWQDYLDGATKTVAIPDDMRGVGPTGSSSGGSDAAYSAEEVREKFNLDFNKDHAKLSGSDYSRETGGDGKAAMPEGAIFTESGEYVGSIDPDAESEYYEGFSDLADAASSIKQKAEGKGFTNVNSFSDVAGAVHWLTKGGKEEKPDTDIPKEMTVKYELSKPAQEAVERVQNYQGKLDSGYYNGAFKSQMQKDQERSANHNSGTAYPAAGASAGNRIAADLDIARVENKYSNDDFKYDYSKEYEGRY